MYSALTAILLKYTLRVSAVHFITQYKIFNLSIYLVYTQLSTHVPSYLSIHLQKLWITQMLHFASVFGQRNGTNFFRGKKFVSEHSS